MYTIVDGEQGLEGILNITGYLAPEVFVSAITYIPENVPGRTSGGYPIGIVG